MLVGDIMSRGVFTVGLDETLQKVRDLFNSHTFHHVLVVEKGRLVGIISDRDLLKNISPFIDKLSEREQDVATLERRAHQIMSRRPITVTEDTTLREAARLMLDRGVSSLPVVADRNRPVGIVTWRDLLNGMIRRTPADKG